MISWKPEVVASDSWAAQLLSAISSPCARALIMQICTVLLPLPFPSSNSTIREANGDINSPQFTPNSLMCVLCVYM